MRRRGYFSDRDEGGKILFLKKLVQPTIFNLEDFYEQRLRSRTQRQVLKLESNT